MQNVAAAALEIESTEEVIIKRRFVKKMACLDFEVFFSDNS